MIVQKDVNITDGLPKQFGDFRVEYLDDQGLIERYKKLHKKFPIIVVRPIKNDRAKLIINFTAYWTSYRNRVLNFELEGGTTVTLGYNCIEQNFVVEKVDLWGV